MTVIDEQTDLQAQVDALTMERDRLIDFRESVYSLALSAQDWNAGHVCNSILNLAIDQKREVIGKGGVVNDDTANRD